MFPNYQKRIIAFTCSHIFHSHLAPWLLRLRKFYLDTVFPCPKRIFQKGLLISVIFTWIKLCHCVTYTRVFPFRLSSGSKERALPVWHHFGNHLEMAGPWVRKQHPQNLWRLSVPSSKGTSSYAFKGQRMPQKLVHFSQHPEVSSSLWPLPALSLAFPSFGLLAWTTCVTHKADMISRVEGGSDESPKDNKGRRKRPVKLGRDLRKKSYYLSTCSLQKPDTTIKETHTYLPPLLLRLK